MSDARPRWWAFPLRSVRAASLVVASVAAVAYANSLENGFAYDDLPVLAGNPALQDLSSLPENLARPYWGEERGWEAGIWRPLTTAALAVQWALWEDDPTPYHAVNVGVHAAVSGLATAVLGHLLPVAAALAGGLLFALHPVHVEAVANVVGVAELLAAFFVLSACLVYLRRSEGSPGAGTVLLLACLYALGFLAKESAALLPALLLLLDAWKDRMSLRDVPGYLRSRGGLFLALAVTAGLVMVARYQVLGGITGTAQPLGGELLEEIPRIWTLPLVWLHYLRLMVFPANLSPDYSPSVIEIQLGWNTLNLVALASTLSVVALAWVAWRRRTMPAVTLGVLWFGVAVLPVANVFFLSEILLAERTLYLPSLGVAAIFGSLVAWLAARRKRWAVGLASVALLLMAARTWTATPIWRNTSTVMNHLLERHPESGRAQWRLADLLLEPGRDPGPGLAMYRLAIGTTRSSYPVVADAVDHLIAMEAFEQAGTLARRMWEDRPDEPRGPARLAVVRARQNRHDAVVEPGEAALALEPENGVLHHLVATAYASEGILEEALHHRRQAIRHGEGRRWLQWRWLAGLQLQSGDTVGALASLDSARVRTEDRGALATLEDLRRSWAEFAPSKEEPSTSGSSGGV